MSAQAEAGSLPSPDGGEVINATFGPPAGEPPPPDAALAQALQTWRNRLAAAGVACRAVAFHADDARWCIPFPAAAGSAALQDTWQQLRARLNADNPVALAKLDGGAAADLVMAASLQVPGGQLGAVGLTLVPPHNERTVQLVLLSLGWLQLALTAASLAHNQRAARLLELMAHVASQDGARAAAQEWVNRTAAWARAEADAFAVQGRAPAARPVAVSGGGAQPGAADTADTAAAPGHFSLVLFDVRRHQPRWWVAADTAWAEKASPAVQDATEAATRAVVDVREQAHGPWWALPLLDQGEVVAVLVARTGDNQATPTLPEPVLAVLRAAAGLAEPLLRHWREADRALPVHAWASFTGALRKLFGPGHWAWKLGGLAVVGALCAVLLWPVPDRVNATTVIEGRTRQMVTAPHEGFIAQALVRPGEQVQQGQPLLRLDDRDLKLEQQKVASEREQASAKLRQAMAIRDAPAMALARAELQQAESQLALVQARLARVVLMAPLAGLVVSGDWVQQVGAPVEAGKELFEIAAAGGWRVVLHVADRDIVRIQPGQAGVLRLTGQPQSVYPFEVSRITAIATVQDGINGFRVEAAWQGEAPPLNPGMQGIGKIEVGQASLLTVWLRPTVDWLRLKLWSLGW